MATCYQLSGITRRLQTHRRNGFTILELMTVLVVVMLLVALIVPAVQATRERARKMNCQNNLKQLFLAASNYESSFGCFPAINGQIEDTYLTKLFPYLEVPRIPIGELTAKRVRIPVLLCPSDWNLIEDLYGYSYVLNAGPKYSETNIEMNGVVAPNSSEGLKLRDITDGSSMTAFQSEKVTYYTPSSSSEALAYPAGAFFEINVVVPSLSTLQDNVQWMFQFADECVQGPWEPVVDPQVRRVHQSMGWQFGLGNSGLYTHYYPPNSKFCTVASGMASDPWFSFRGGAQSQHAGGVNTLFADGHIKFVTQTVDRKVWHAHGTRDGGESIEGL
jgi:prepilin-type processing-associated H-X9-DG protein